MRDLEIGIGILYLQGIQECGENNVKIGWCLPLMSVMVTMFRMCTLCSYNQCFDKNFDIPREKNVAIGLQIF